MIGFLLVAIAITSWVIVIAFTPPVIMLVGCAMLFSFVLGIVFAGRIRQAMRPTPELREEMLRRESYQRGGLRSWE